MSDTAARPALLPRRVRTAAPFAVAVVWLVVVLVSPPFLGPYYVGVAATVGITALLAMGISLITGLTGQFSLAQAAFFGVGAYGSGLLTVRLGWPPLVALAASAAVAVGSAYLLGRPIFRLRGHFLAMGTLALAEIFYLVVGTLPATGASSGFGGIVPLSVLGFEFSGVDQQYFLVWILVGLCLWGLLRMRSAREGRALRAVRGHETAAAACGIDVGWSKTRAFAGSAFLGSIAGSVYAHQLLYVNPPPFSPLKSIDILAVAVLGGLATPWGAVVGAISYQVLQQVVSDALPGLLGEGAVGAGETLVVGALLVIVLILRSDGIVGALGAATNRVASAVQDRRQPSAAAARAETIPGAGAVNARVLKDGITDTGAVDAGTTGSRAACPGERIVLEARALTRRYGGVHALDGVDLQLREHEILAVIGPNGAGKSTLVNVLTGVTPPSSGQVLVDGSDRTGSAPHTMSRAGLARTFQTPTLFEGLTVLQNVQVGAHVLGSVGMVRAAVQTPAALREERDLAGRAHGALERIGLAHLADRTAVDLSLGQQKLVEVARALAAHPTVLLMDEPGAGLNRVEKQRLAETIRQMRRDGIAIVVIEHDMEFVMSLADRVHVLEFGQTLKVGSPAEVQRDPEVVRAYLGAAPAAEPESAARTEEVIHESA